MAPAALCFGEVLWDSLSEGLFPGGAPCNVAYHLHHQGVATHLASAVGRDWLGDELLRRVRGWGLTTVGIGRPSGLPTGAVGAKVGRDGEVRYTIARDAAWDRIPASAASLRAAARARAIVFGSLAQRSAHNRATLRRLLSARPPGAEAVFDINLRAPFDDLALVRDLCRRATLLKLNADEAARLLEAAAAKPGREEAHARELADGFGVAVVCITAGARGAGLLHGGRWFWEPARKVALADPVGAGDAFLASLVAQVLKGRKAPAQILARACRLGEWVASQRGATPDYSTSPS